MMSDDLTKSRLQSRTASPGKRSSRRYIVNRRLLLVTVIVLAVTLPTGYLWYRHQLRRTADGLLARAEQLETEHDWRQATAYYQRYLLLEPADTPTLVRMVEAFSKLEPTVDRLNRLNSLLYRAVGRVPNRYDLRVMLAENLLRLERFNEAEQEANEVLKQEHEEDGPELEEARKARKILALSLARRPRDDGSPSVADVARKLWQAARELPGDVELIVETANTLRGNPSLSLREFGSSPATDQGAADSLAANAAASSDISNSTRADQLMDQLVAADPQNVEARLARYLYRKRNKLADTDRDLQAALELDPNHVDALLLSASAVGAAANSEERRAEAESLLRRAIDAAPNDPDAYLVSATILDQAGDRHGALELLQKGRDATDNNFDLGLALANVQVRAGALADAERTLRDLELQGTTYLVRLKPTVRTQKENQLLLLRARIDVAQEAPREAVPRLQTVLLSNQGYQGSQRSPEWMEATALMAQIHAGFGEWDKASERWRDLAAVAPDNADVVRAAVDAHLRAGNTQAAVEQLDEFPSHAKLPADLLVLQVQAHLANQLSRPTGRIWSEFQAALDAAKSDAGDRLEIVVAEVRYLLTRAAEAQDLDAATQYRQTAADLLRNSEQKFAGQAEFWRIAAEFYQRLGHEQQAADVERALAKHRELAASETDHAMLEARLLVSKGRFTEADALLADLELSLSGAERRRVGRSRVSVLAAANDLSGALQLVKQLIQSDPQDTELLAVGIDLALSAQDFQTAEEWESKLGEATGNGPEARYLQASRLLLMYEQLDREEQQELTRSIRELRAERPRWYPAVALSARLAELQGDSRGALLDYELAVDLGDRRAFTLQRVVTLLGDYDRLDEAQAYLSRFVSDQLADPIVGSMAVELTATHDRTAALKLAQQSVAQFPNDPTRRITLANLLLGLGQPQEAVQVLHEAAQKFTDNVRVWTTLFTALVRADRVEEARLTLSALVSNSALSKARRHFVAAQGYEILGDGEEAKKHYEMAIAEQPQEIGVRLRLAKLLSSSDPRAARDQYERVLQQEPENREACRELAILLAATGQEGDWARADQLLASAGDKSVVGARTNDRVRAVLLSRKGRTRAERIANCQAARNILERLIEAGGAAHDLEHVLIAQILEDESELSGDRKLLSAAAGHLRTVAQQEPPAAEKLARYIEFLLAHAQPPATNSVEDAVAEGADSDVVKLKETFLTDAETALEDLRRLSSSGDDGVAALTVALTARLLKIRGRDAEAQAHIADFVARETESSVEPTNQAQQFLTIGRLYSSIGAHADAEKWYRRLTELTPNAYVLVVQSLVAQGKRREAAEFCLSVSDGQPTPEVAAMLAGLMTVTDEPVEELLAARVAIEAAVKEHSDNVQLLQSEAVMRASRGQYDEAITNFRRIVELEPNNALALNNLATLLAERPNQRAEALEHIQRAIDIEGRRATLLDTQGTILLKLGDHQQAIACLEEATASGAADARYYLHLAAAYRLGKRNDDARQMLKEARAFGIERFVLTDDDRQLLEELEQQLETSP